MLTIPERHVADFTFTTDNIGYLILEFFIDKFAAENFILVIDEFADKMGGFIGIANQIHMMFGVGRSHIQQGPDLLIDKTCPKLFIFSHFVDTRHYPFHLGNNVV